MDEFTCSTEPLNNFTIFKLRAGSSQNDGNYSGRSQGYFQNRVVELVQESANEPGEFPGERHQAPVGNHCAHANSTSDERPSSVVAVVVGVAE